MTYWRGTHAPCGGALSFNKDISEDEAYCENCGWVYLWDYDHTSAEELAEIEEQNRVDEEKEARQ